MAEKEQKLHREPEEKTESEMWELYRKFKTTGQEKIRLNAALDGLFPQNPEKKETEESRKSEYEAYLKRRIRAAMELLIDREDTFKMELLEQYGWFGEKELELFLKFSREHHRHEAFVWLLRLKDRKYGYKDREFPL